MRSWSISFLAAGLAAALLFLAWRSRAGPAETRGPAAPERIPEAAPVPAARATTEPEAQLLRERADTELDVAAAGDPLLVRVRCVDRTGAGVEDLAVHARRLGDGPFQYENIGSAISGPDGRAHFQVVADWPSERDWLSLQLTPANGYAYLRWEGPRTSAEVVLVVERGGTLRGHLLFDDGAPIEERGSYTISWRQPDGTSMSTNGVIGERGHFDTGPVLAGVVDEVTVRRWNLRTLQLPVPGLTVGPGAVVERDFLFAAGCDCTARFVDALTREPIVGATVRTLDYLRGETDEAGVVHLVDAIGLGAETTLRFEHPDYPDLRARVACPATGGEQAPTFEVPRGYELKAVVQDAGGSPLPGLEVTCEFHVGSLTGMGSRFGGVQKLARTDAEGRFAMSGFEEGIEYVLSLRRDRRAIASERLRFPAAAERDVFVVQPPQTTSGMVLDAEGQPVAGMEVVALAPWGTHASTATTATDGTFTLEGLFAGSWFAYAQYGVPFPGGNEHYSARRIAGRWFEVYATGAELLKLRLPASGERVATLVPFEVRAFDAVTSAPLESFDLLQINGIDNTLSLGLGGAELDSGTFRHSTPEGRYDFFLRTRGYALDQQEVELVPSARPIRIEFWLEPEG